MSWNRSVDGEVNGVKVEKVEPSLGQNLIFGDRTEYNVEGEKFDTRSEAYERALEKADEKSS